MSLTHSPVRREKIPRNRISCRESRNRLPLVGRVCPQRAGGVSARFAARWGRMRPTTGFRRRERFNRPSLPRPGGTPPEISRGQVRQCGRSPRLAARNGSMPRRGIEESPLPPASFPSVPLRGKPDQTSPHRGQRRAPGPGLISFGAPLAQPRPLRLVSSAATRADCQPRRRPMVSGRDRRPAWRASGRGHGPDRSGRRPSLRRGGRETGDGTPEVRPREIAPVCGR